MRKAILLLGLAAAATADEAAIAKAREAAKAGPDVARAAVPELIELGKGSAWERFAARDALAVAGPPALAALIGEAGGNPSLRLLLEGVSHDLGAGVVAPALPLLASKDPKVRAMAAVSLGAAGKGGEAGVKKLIEALYDKDALVRAEAATALGRIGRGAHDAVPGLILLANDRERACTREALLALGMILRDAAERERTVPKVPPEVASAIEKGLKWLLAQQQADGSWDVPEANDPHVRAYVTSLGVLAMLEGGAPDRHAPRLRTALRYVVATDASGGRHAFEAPWWVTRETVAATLCAAARVLGEPECRHAAAQAITALAASDDIPGPDAWSALMVLEAGFAGLVDPAMREMAVADVGSLVGALVRLAAGDDPKSDELRRLIESCGSVERLPYADSWALAARARSYGDVKSDALAESARKRQREDGSWDSTGDALGPVHATACMLLCLEAASGLAHPLTMPLPDAPQLKAAVATLRIAAQSKDPAIRAAAEQALAGFAVR